jgi:hypothetical protein
MERTCFLAAALNQSIYLSARKAPAFMPEMDSATARRLDAAAAV